MCYLQCVRMTVPLYDGPGRSTPNYALGVDLTGTSLPSYVPNEVMIMQDVFQELWGVFGILLMLLCIGCLLHTVFSFVGSCLEVSSRGRVCSCKLSNAPTVKHLAVIMDGNRRYGRSKYGVATKGHWDGGQTLCDFIDWSMEGGVEILTVYAFSTENWKRDPAEIEVLMTIFQQFSLKIQSTAVEKNIRVRFLSSHPEPLPAHIQALTRTIEEATQHGASLCLNVCLSYGSRGEIVNACKSIADKVRAGELGVDQIDERLFARHLLTHDQPDPDLVLRTSGECRVSNYLLYQLAYSELAFVDKPWPAITRDDLNNVLQQYEQRHRRFGK